MDYENLDHNRERLKTSSHWLLKVCNLFKYSLEEDVKSCNDKSDHIDEHIAKGIVNDPLSAIVVPIRELDIDDLLLKKFKFL